MEEAVATAAVERSAEENTLCVALVTVAGSSTYWLLRREKKQTGARNPTNSPLTHERLNAKAGPRTPTIQTAHCRQISSNQQPRQPPAHDHDTRASNFAPARSQIPYVTTGKLIPLPSSSLELDIRGVFFIGSCPTLGEGMECQ